MELLELIARVRGLLGDPEANWSEIARLLGQNKQRAEVEVVRLLVAQAVEGEVGRKARSVDPRERRRAAEMIPLVLPRSLAAAALRRLVKDPDRHVRTLAAAGVRALGFTDVALPDRRFVPLPLRALLVPGCWDASGWFYGLPHPDLPTRARRPRHQGLPPLGGEAEAAALVGYASAADLRRLLRPGAGRGAPYVEFTVPKASGGERTLAAPRSELKKVQRIVLRELLQKLPVHAACHGFVRGRSVLTNAAPHAGAAVIVKTDLRDFFPSVHYRRVVGLFEQYGYGRATAKVLAALTTRRPVLADGAVAWPGALPQGAPTSPAIANLICRRLDARLAGLARRAGGSYTRYADDLTFSFAVPPSLGLGRFFWWVDQICQQEGFEENTAKRRVVRSHQQQRVTGVVVNEQPAVPRKLRRLVRAIVHNCKKLGVASQQRGRQNFAAWLRGLVAYIHAVQPELGARWMREVDELLGPG